MARRRAELPEEDYRALAQFRHLIRSFLAFSAKASRKAGLPPQQHQALLSLKGLPAGRAPTVSSLAWHLQLRHHSAVGLVDRLTRKGLVRRTPGAEDRRQVLLSLTPRAETLLRRLSLQHREELRRSGPKLFAALRAVLAR
jgi:DNA-binding MarR family transcriptional regulator